MTLAGFATRAIHAGYEPDWQGAVNPPLYLSSSFEFASAEEGGQRFLGEVPGHIYSRISNPTLDLLEKRVAALEQAEAGLALSSGMGAITSVLWTFLSPGDEIITDTTIYGCTFAFMHHGLEKFGVKITHVDMTKPENVRDALTADTKVVYFETPSNPNMRLVDIEQVAHIVRRHGARTIVDNTYATPYLTRPIPLGADIVVHSATKYLGGHGDLIGGIALGQKADIDEVRMHGMKNMTGAVMAPFNAMLVLRGLKTLALRMERHCETAGLIAQWLETEPAVDKVFYPGLSSFPQHELAVRQMPRFGAIIAFELKDGFRAGAAMMNGLNLIRRAVSLGDTETLMQHPASMTHSTYTAEEQGRHDISQGLMRLSVGLEDFDDIRSDMAVALASIPPLISA
jgi:methionine-gamma-lyase